MLKPRDFFPGGDLKFKRCAPGSSSLEDVTSNDYPISDIFKDVLTDDIAHFFLAVDCSTLKS